MTDSRFLSARCSRLRDRFTTGIGLCAALLCFSCAPVRLPQPSDPDPVADEAHFLALERHCQIPFLASRSVVTASARVHGTSGGRSVSGRVWLGVDYANLGLRVESWTPGEFLLTSENALLADGGVTDGFADLYLARHQKIVRRGNSRELLAAVLGVPLPAHEFISAFSGCRHSWSGEIETRTLGPNATHISFDTGEVVLKRRDSRSPWTLFSTRRRSQGQASGWLAEYTRHRDVMRSVRIVSEDANGVTGRLFNLQFWLSDVQLAPLALSETFTPTVPPDIQSVSLDTLTRPASRPMVNWAR